MPTDPLAQLLRLVDAAAPLAGAVTVVAIDGPSGSGKTTLGVELAQRVAAPVVHMDELYPGWDGLAAAVRIVTDQILRPLSAGRDVRYRRWDWHAGQWGDRVQLPWTALLVLEGCGSSVRPAGDHAAVRVWMDADPQVRHRRAVARDGAAYAPHWQRWAAQEQALFTADRTRERADLIVDTTGPDPTGPDDCAGPGMGARR